MRWTQAQFERPHTGLATALRVDRAANPAAHGERLPAAQIQGMTSNPRRRLDLHFAQRWPPTELQVHIAVAGHLRHRAVPGLWWTHPPFGEIRDKATGAKLKAIGARPGTPDLLLLRAGRFYALELKRDDGRLSAAQRIVRNEIEAAGGFWAVAYGIDAALAVLMAWGLLRSGPCNPGDEPGNAANRNQGSGS